MDSEDFGSIALTINEYGNLGGEIFIGNVSGEVRIVYKDSGGIQKLRPCDLSNMLTLKINEYEEELEPLVKERDDKDDAPDWHERNLKSYIGFLRTAQHQLSMLTTFQKERDQEQE